jgi:hypothetical protein
MRIHVLSLILARYLHSRKSPILVRLKQAAAPRKIIYFITFCCGFVHSCASSLLLIPLGKTGERKPLYGFARRALSNAANNISSTLKNEIINSDNQRHKKSLALASYLSYIHCLHSFASPSKASTQIKHSLTTHIAFRAIAFSPRQQAASISIMG